MRKIFYYTCACLIFFPLINYAATTTAVCEPPQGTRVDYFTQNNINLQNNTFLMGRDRVSGMKPKIVLNDDNKNVLFVIGDASEIKTEAKTGNMQVLAYNDEQISFTGMINGAPILATYYPKIMILIYSQQSIWPGPNYAGARAVIFYSKCAIEQPTQATMPAATPTPTTTSMPQSTPETPTATPTPTTTPMPQSTPETPATPTPETTMP